ncbi:hypothetical protein GWI33_009561 [Rhynchophorus ferrugineus]|uniref:Uncharacterized protein n=1 Tax=Rhynchophorus ferrugineus TaxID=354439 RepID=A0A834IDB9_RHYFE|nr:hypothetical protein GWI33_009561 [Rhynchophorus ferrugineus]
MMKMLFPTDGHNPSNKLVEIHANAETIDLNSARRASDTTRAPEGYVERFLKRTKTTKTMPSTTLQKKIHFVTLLRSQSNLSQKLLLHMQILFISLEVTIVSN